jgi:hypothetical protein
MDDATPLCNNRSDEPLAAFLASTGMWCIEGSGTVNAYTKRPFP